MKEIKVRFEEDTELAEYEAVNKGYRRDVYVTIGTYMYNVRIYSIVRLQQDFESEFMEYGFYSIEPNLILVNETNRTEIIDTITRLYKENFFEQLKPLNID